MMRRIRAGPYITVYLIRSKKHRRKNWPYRLRWQEPGGKWRQRTVKTHNRADAEKAREWWQAQLNGWNDKADRPITYGEFQEAYLEHKTPELARASVQAAKWTLLRFARTMAPRLLLDINLPTVETYKSRRLREVRAATVRKELRTLHAAFSWAVKMGYIKTNPAAGVGYPRGPAREKVVLSPEESRRLLQEVEKRGTPFAAFVCLALETGMRIGEIANLQPADIDFANRWVRIRPKQDWSPKGKRERIVRVSPVTGRLLWQLHDCGPYILAGTNRDDWKRLMRQQLKEACRAAGVPEVTPHDLRRTAATLMALAGVPIDVAQRVLGHESYQTTQKHYIRIREREAADIALKLLTEGNGTAPLCDVFVTKAAPNSPNSSPNPPSHNTLNTENTKT